MSKVDLKSLPEPGSKYKLGLKIGGGVGGEVYEAVENQTEKKVAIKMIDLKKETEEEIQREYQVLKQMSANENFLEFYGIYSKKGNNNTQKIWLVVELCEGGDVTSLVRKLEQENKKMSELHIAYIIRECIKAVIRLQENDISHRDVRGSNILLTADGRVKLIDYGISKRVEKNKKMKTCVGSPSWLAPEVIACQTDEGSSGYDKKADVWAIGITAIELGDGQAPFEDTHPGRALFQIVNNPPPTLRKPSDWSQLYNDFISECLVKNPENRPFVQELLVHPFFEPLEKEENLLEGLSILLERYKSTALYKEPDIQVRKGFLKIEDRTTPEKILHEDLATMSKVSEDSILFELHERLKRNEFQTYIGDILLILNSNKISDAYGIQYHKKYRFKAKSQNAPHIYSIAESAYREVFHHEKPQQILFAGETGTGKTVNMMHAMDHLLFIGQGLKSSEKVLKGLSAIHAMGNAATPHNSDSTRHILQTQITFTDTGKVSGVVFRVYLLEKSRVTMMAKKQSNFHLFYYFYEAMRSQNKLSEYYLGEDEYNLLKTEPNNKPKTFDNISQFELFESNLKELGFEEDHINSIRKILAAILLTGQIEFLDDEDGYGVLATPETVQNVADLLGVDNKKLSWALLNYCLIVNGEAVMRRNSKHDAEEAKYALARGLYSRLVDWVVNTINEKISVFRVIYGDRHVISLLDHYGFECYSRNSLDQLFVNTINEQMQFHYNQKLFAWEKETAKEEQIPFPDLEFKNNKIVLDLILSKPDGLLHKIDEATREEDSSNLLAGLKPGKESPVFAETSKDFSIIHYTGKITYSASDMMQKNGDFLPPEIIDTMRLSSEEVIKEIFSSLFSKSGNLSRVQGRRSLDETAECQKNVSTTPSGRFSQSRQMRTAATTFRGACADLFKSLTSREFGFHFVRCIRTDLSNKIGAFDPEVVRQQLRALTVVNTVLTIQRGYSYSVSHEEFIRRYKFLAFDFDENVEETKENCRLLLLRLKLEGWTMGKTKVFLKYYNKEYLTRLYETQIKKIVKVQSMMRTFIARRKLYVKIKRYQVDADKSKFIGQGGQPDMEAKAAEIIQRRYREYAASKCGLTEDQKEFIWPWYKRWRTKSIFQVLLLYRAERLQTLVNFCLQIHLYNQGCLSSIQKTIDEIELKKIDKEAKSPDYFPPTKPSIPKLLFLWKSLNPREDISNCEPLPDCKIQELEAEVQENLNKRASESKQAEPQLKNYEDKEIQTSLNEESPLLENEEPTEVPKKEPEEKEQEPEEMKQEPEKKEQEPEEVKQEPEEKKKEPEEKKQELEEKEREPQEKKQEADEKEQVPATRFEEETTENKAPLQEPIRSIAELRRQSNVTEDSIPESEYKQPEPKIQPQPREKTPNSQPPPIKPRRNSRTTLPPEKKFQTSISEMEARFKNLNYNENSDDPPFNFRSLLRKTNYSTAPRKTSNEDLTLEKEIKTFNFSDRKKSLPCGNYRRHSDTIVTELLPGILVYGKIADL